MMVLLHTNGNRSTWRRRTVGFQGARFAIFHGKLDLDHLIISTINGWRPTQTLLPSWARRYLRLPINRKTSSIKALFLFCLLCVICPRWSDKIYSIFPTTLDKLLGLCIIGIGEVLFW